MTRSQQVRYRAAREVFADRLAYLEQAGLGQADLALSQRQRLISSASTYLTDPDDYDRALVSGGLAATHDLDHLTTPRYTRSPPRGMTWVTPGQVRCTGWSQSRV